MDDKEKLKTALLLLDDAKNEINRLRSDNEIISEKLYVFDSMMALIYANPGRREFGAMHPDIIYEIDKFKSSL